MKLAVASRSTSHTFGDHAQQVELRTLKVGLRFDFQVPRSDWVLP